MKVKNKLIYLLFFQIIAKVYAQDSILFKKDTLIFSVYLDCYTPIVDSKMDFGKIPFMVSMNATDPFAVNLAFIKFSYKRNGLRATFAPAIGTYMSENYAAEKGFSKNLLEASAGFRLSKKRAIWMDFGVLPSPFTNETAISKDYLMYSRSLAAEYVPYYVYGLRTTLPLSKRLTFYVYALQGWQQITDVNKSISLTTQLEFKPDSVNLLNWDVYIGNERSDSNPQLSTRYFTDVYWVHQFSKKWAFTTCAYIGFQDALEFNQNPRFWYQANVIAAYQLKKHQRISGRVEYFSDPEHTILPIFDLSTSTRSLVSGSLSYANQLNAHFLFRTEYRHFLSQDPYFISKSGIIQHFGMAWLSMVFSY